jgi:hypothetical protein
MSRMANISEAEHRRANELMKHQEKEHARLVEKYCASIAGSMSESAPRSGTVSGKGAADTDKEDVASDEISQKLLDRFKQVNSLAKREREILLQILDAFLLAPASRQ